MIGSITQRFLGSLGILLALPLHAATPATTEINLIAILDEARGYCIDMVGYKERARVDRPLQAHTCYSYQGGVAVDQGVESQAVHAGQIRFPYFGVCVRVERAQAGASLLLDACADRPEQKFRFTDTGEIHPEAAPELCVTIAAPDGVPGGGGKPVHLLRPLGLEACAAPAVVRQRWRLR